MKLRPFFTRSSPISNLNKKGSLGCYTQNSHIGNTKKQKRKNVQYEIVVITSIFSFVIASNKM